MTKVTLACGHPFRKARKDRRGFRCRVCDREKRIAFELLKAEEEYSPAPHRVTIEAVKQRVCARYGLPAQAMTGPIRARGTAWPRQTAMYLARKVAGKTLPEIGRRFGGRDHTTVLYAVRAVEARRAADPALDAEIAALEQELRG